MAPALRSEIHLHPSVSSRTASPTYIIYYITGNPGLIEYYRTFLTHLYGLLTEPGTGTSDSATFHIYGRSLSGFETNSSSKESGEANEPPYSLQEQIGHSEEALESLVRDVRDKDSSQDVRVILMGHSVGSYILLELTRRLREKAENNEDGVRIVGGVCLFPTVAHIAKSDSGRKSSWLLNMGSFARIASLAAKALTFPIPVSVLTLLIRGVMRFPADAAHVTASFVKSQHGVQQALHMARDEMQEITTDAWDADIWGASHPTPHLHNRPVLRFLFAKEDHWVADETRDELIRERGILASTGKYADQDEDEDEVEVEGEEWKPLMEIDEDEGWPHGFCIKHSVPVAERVSGYVRDIIDKVA